MIYAYVMKFFLPGFCTHSCNAFWSLLTWRGLLAIPTKAMISKNSASPASQSWCTSSPPNNLLELWKVSKHNHAIEDNWRFYNLYVIFLPWAINVSKYERRFARCNTRYSWSSDSFPGCVVTDTTKTKNMIYFGMYINLIQSKTSNKA